MVLEFFGRGYFAEHGQLGLVSMVRLLVKAKVNIEVVIIMPT